MNQLLQKAFDRAAELPQAEQDRFTRFLLSELESERQWAELFRPELEDLLECLASEALAEHRAGRTRPLALEDLYVKSQPWPSPANLRPAGRLRGTGWSRHTTLLK